MPTIKSKAKIQISQQKLKRYLELTLAAQELKLLKEELVSQLRNNISVQEGRLFARLKVNTGKRTPKWKEHYTSLAEHFFVGEGEKMAQAILDSTEKGDDSYGVEVIDTKQKHLRPV